MGEMKNIVGNLFLILFLAGCAEGLKEERVKEVEQVYSLNAVKAIDPSISDGRSEESYSQDTYTVNPERRLLVRLEELSSHVSFIQVKDGKKIWVRISLQSESDKALAMDSLRFCPLTKQWLILATWKYAHPFGAIGQWAQSGGDFDAANCIHPSIEYEEVISTNNGSSGNNSGNKNNGNNPPVPKKMDPKIVSFDVTQWVVDYPKSRGINYGLILLSNAPLVVYGDASSTFSPRIAWTEEREKSRWSSVR